MALLILKSDQYVSELVQHNSKAENCRKRKLYIWLGSRTLYVLLFVCIVWASCAALKEDKTIHSEGEGDQKITSLLAREFSDRKSVGVCQTNSFMKTATLSKSSTGLMMH